VETGSSKKWIFLKIEQPEQYYKITNNITHKFFIEMLLQIKNKQILSELVFIFNNSIDIKYRLYTSIIFIFIFEPIFIQYMSIL